MDAVYQEEIPVIFKCHENDLIGIVHRSDPDSKLGVLLVVGGPQYRVGSHRQFVLLARMLSANGITAMRFDYRGMGDSEGNTRTFISVDDDIARAIDAFQQTCPQLTRVVIWGLCDAASAALFYAYQDTRVQGLVLLNPWVYTEQGAATAYVKHYYLKRLLNPDFWRKIISLKFNYLESLRSFLRLLKTMLSKYLISSENVAKTGAQFTDKVDDNLSLPARMRECLRRFKFPVLLILSGNDLTADEFKGVVGSDVSWQAILKESRVTRFDFKDADHTFSSEAMRNRVAEETLRWLNQLNAKFSN
jgi:uncharacterized protein